MDRGEPALDLLGDDGAAGHDAVAVEQSLGGRVDAQRRVALGHGQRRPAPGGTRRAAALRDRGSAQPRPTAVAATGRGTTLRLVGAAATGEQSTYGREGVAGDQPPVRERPQHVGELLVVDPLLALGPLAGECVGEVAEEVGATSGQGLVHAGLDRAEVGGVGEREGRRRTVGEVQADPCVVTGQTAVPGPEHLARRHEVVEHGGDGVVDPGGQDERLEGAGRHRHAAQLLDGPQHAVASAHAAPHALPPGQEAGVLPRLDRLDLVTQRREGAPAQHPQDLGVAELTTAAAALDRQEIALDEPAGLHQASQGVGRHGSAEAVVGGEVG